MRAGQVSEGLVVVVEDLLQLELGISHIGCEIVFLKDLLQYDVV